MKELEWSIGCDSVNREVNYFLFLLTDLSNEEEEEESYGQMKMTNRACWSNGIAANGQWE
jgi:hypothetical protein